MQRHMANHTERIKQTKTLLWTETKREHITHYSLNKQDFMTHCNIPTWRNPQVQGKGGRKRDREIHMQSLHSERGRNTNTQRHTMGGFILYLVEGPVNTGIIPSEFESPLKLSRISLALPSFAFRLWLALLKIYILILTCPLLH